LKYSFGTCIFIKMSSAKNKKIIRKTKIALLVFVFIFPLVARADSLGENRRFFVDKLYDALERRRITATLEKESERAYFYIDDSFWRELNEEERKKAKDSLESLARSFDTEIYPNLTNLFGSEWKLGLDGDRKITILFEKMESRSGGYFRSGDGYRQVEVPNSNEREMIYINALFLNSPRVSTYVAHEFVHLITFNQKNRLRRVEEEVWLNEARAEYASTFLGYDNAYQGSNLAKRVGIFIMNPSDAITDWEKAEKDYGALNIFTQYLVEKYGVEILVDSLHSSKVGIESINYALSKRGYDVTFSDVFSDFLVAVYVNDCSLGENYCFRNKNLSNLKISPQVNFLPLEGSSSLGVSHRSEQWAGNWFKFVGGKKGALKIEFIGNPDAEFNVPYVIRDFSGEHALGFFQLDKNQRGKIIVSGFGSDVSSVTIIPFVQSKADYGNNKKDVSFFFEATTITEKGELEKEKENGSDNYLQRPISEMSEGEILAKISQLKSLLNQLEKQLEFLRGEEAPAGGQEIPECSSININLRRGMSGAEVRCLQSFLKNQEDNIYPEGLVTGYFGPLTEQAVIRFQEKYKEEVLSPWGLSQGTGFVGETTREKINDLIR